jgi:hypothetical protein
LETHLLICQRRNYGDATALSNLVLELAAEQKMIYRYNERLGED